MTLKEGLSVAYECDEAAGADMVDAHGSGLALIAQNSPGSNTGKLGGARVFQSGLSHFFNRATNAAFETGDASFALAAWAYFGDLSADRTIVAKASATAGSMEYRLRYRTLGVLTFSVYKAGDVEVAINVGFAPTLSTWYLLIAQHDQANRRIGISKDGAATAWTGYSGSLQAAGTAPFRVGATSIAGSPDYMHGRLDAVRLWKGRTLSDGEIALQWNGGAGLAYASLAPRSAPMRRRRRTAQGFLGLAS